MGLFPAFVRLQPRPYVNTILDGLYRIKFSDAQNINAEILNPYKHV